jgi:hypothetical protein
MVKVKCVPATRTGAAGRGVFANTCTEVLNLTSRDIAQAPERTRTASAA